VRSSFIGSTPSRSSSRTPSPRNTGRRGVRLVDPAGPEVLLNDVGTA
jgi:hypothetical protein